MPDERLVRLGAVGLSVVARLPGLDHKDFLKLRGLADERAVPSGQRRRST